MSVALLVHSNETLVENLNLTVSCSLKSVHSNDNDSDSIQQILKDFKNFENSEDLRNSKIL